MINGIRKCVGCSQTKQIRNVDGCSFLYIDLLLPLSHSLFLILSLFSLFQLSPSISPSHPLSLCSLSTGHLECGRHSYGNSSSSINYLPYRSGLLRTPTSPSLSPQPPFLFLTLRVFRAAIASSSAGIASASWASQSSLSA